MRRDFLTRLERLERARTDRCGEKLNQLARKLGAEPGICSRLVRGQETELDRELGPDEGITWPGFVRLYNLMRTARGQDPVPESGWRLDG